jgi:hypothetical protein
MLWHNDSNADEILFSMESFLVSQPAGITLHVIYTNTTLPRALRIASSFALKYPSHLVFQPLAIREITLGTCLRDDEAYWLRALEADGGLPPELQLAVLAATPGVFFPPGTVFASSVLALAQTVGAFAQQGPLSVRTCEAMGWGDPRCWAPRMLALFRPGQAAQLLALACASLTRAPLADVLAQGGAAAGVFALPPAALDSVPRCVPGNASLDLQLRGLAASAAAMAPAQRSTLRRILARVLLSGRPSSPLNLGVLADQEEQQREHGRDGV